MKNKIINVSASLSKSSLSCTENKFMKIIDVCNALSISKPTLNSWVEKGVLRRIKIQSRVYFDRKEVMSLLDNKKS